MTAAQLDLLIRALTPALEDRRERLRHEHRGGNRLRARGASAKDTLPTPDRILATVLHQRKIGTHDLLAALFGVTRNTMSRAVQEVQPLLAEDGHTISPSTARFRTPADVAAFLTPEATQPEIKSPR
ncbi:transposase family protein [Streptomyces sp. NPDC015127]|uniref:helix-turn-helix domain-containing protein n=1 Tax=Streptomyces sp. NPDC015127 TaxID=3364939 RepID=UPI0036FA4383